MSTVSPNQQYLPTLAVMQAVRQQLQSLTLPAPYTSLGKTFQDVRVYAEKNLGQALQDLLVVVDRVALIVPTDFSHRNGMDGTNLTSRRTLEFVLLIADRALGGTANEAALGGTQNPGAVLLAELAIAALTGFDCALAAACIEPLRGQPLVVGAKDAASDQTFAREAWAQTFSTPAGEMRVDRGRRRPFGPVASPVIANSGT